MTIPDTDWGGNVIFSSILSTCRAQKRFYTASAKSGLLRSVLAGLRAAQLS